VFFLPIGATINCSKNNRFYELSYDDDDDDDDDDNNNNTDGNDIRPHTVQTHNESISTEFNLVTA
jgi:hypothetical protein